MNTIQEINRLKNELIAIAEKHSMNLLHPEVIQYSEALDQLILRAMSPSRSLAS